MSTHKPDCDVYDANIEGIIKPCNCSTESEFSKGVVSMANNILPAIHAVRDGKWTLDQVEQWLNAVITNDPNYLSDIESRLL